MSILGSTSLKDTVGEIYVQARARVAKADVRVAVCGTWLIQFTKRAKLTYKPELHGVRRAIALNMLRSGPDIFVLQRLTGYSDLRVLRRYLAQNDEDNQLVAMRGSPVDNNL